MSALVLIAVLTLGQPVTMPQEPPKPTPPPHHTDPFVAPPPAGFQTPQTRAEPTPEDWAQRIADCESGDRLPDGTAVPGSHNLTAMNGHSSATGKYQFLTGTWEWVTGLPAPAKGYPEEAQDAAFKKLWDGGRGWQHWLASKSCWDPNNAFYVN